MCIWDTVYLFLSQKRYISFMYLLILSVKLIRCIPKCGEETGNLLLDRQHRACFITSSSLEPPFCVLVVFLIKVHLMSFVVVAKQHGTFTDETNDDYYFGWNICKICWCITFGTAANLKLHWHCFIAVI